MRILIISKYFPPENSVASLRPFSWAKYWVREGHQVEILTTIKDKNRLEAIPLNRAGFEVHEVDFSSFFYKLKSIYKKNNSPSQADNGKEVEALTLSKPANNTSFSKKVFLHLDEWRKSRGLFLTARMPDTMDLWIKPATDWAKNNGPWDLVVSTHGPYACHLIGLNIKNLNLTKYWIADFRDLWTENHIYKGVFPFTAVENVLERKILAKADVVTTVSEPLASTLKRKYPFAKVYVIENGFDTEEVQNIPKEKIFTDNKIRIVHTGTIYKNKMSPELLFEAMAGIAADPQTAHLLNNLEVVFAGASNELVMEQAKRMKVDRWVKDAGFLPRQDILRMQREAHALLFLGFDKGKTAGLVSGKLFEYLFSNTPIWAVDVNDQFLPGQIILKAEAGKLFGEDMNLLKNALLALLQHPLKREVQPNARFLQKFERSYLAQSMLQLISRGVSE